MPDQVRVWALYEDEAYERELPQDLMVPVATHEELLEYANRVRELGGADTLDALLPSKPVDAKACLIAQAVNFESSVVPDDSFHESGSQRWYMVPWRGNDAQSDELARELAEKLDAETGVVNVLNGKQIQGPYGPISDRSERVGVLLPEEIGNAAMAFDLGIAFTDLAIGY